MDYYDDERLSQSKIKDYRKCPHLYFRRHIKKDAPEQDNKNFVLGSAVDCYVTQGQEEFEREYYHAKQNGDRPDDATRLTPAVYQQAVRMSQAVIRQPFMRRFEEYDAQRSFFTEQFKGKLDYFHADTKKKTGVIADLKTVRDTDKFKYDFFEYGYNIQLAFYEMLAKQCGYGDDVITHWDHYIIAVDKTKNNKVALFKLFKQRIKEGNSEIKRVLRHMKKYPEYDKQYIPGVCYHCPIEIDCPHSKLSTEDIINL